MLLVITSSTLAMAARELKTKDFSGWMNDYDSLVFSEERNAYLFLNEAKRGSYSKVILDEVVIYSENGEAGGQIAEESTSYLAKGFGGPACQQGYGGVRSRPRDPANKVGHHCC